jgi:hypothetical protein
MKIIILCLLCPLIVGAQNTTEGKIVFDVQYESAFASALPKTEIVYFSQTVIRNVTEVPASIVVQGVNYIYFKDSLKFYTLYKMGREIDGHKQYAISEEPSALKFYKPKESKKTILGYPCKEMGAESVDGKQRYTFYYTDQLGTSYLPLNLGANLQDVFVLQYTTRTDQWIKTAKARSIDFVPIENKLTFIPADFKTITRADFKLLSGGTMISK